MNKESEIHMLKGNAKALPVKARLKVDMVIAGEPREAGYVVEEMPVRDFKYLSNLDRVEAAPASKGK